MVHGDISCQNLVLDGKKLKMIDWSFAGFREEWGATGVETKKKRFDYDELRGILGKIFPGIETPGPRNVLSL